MYGDLYAVAASDNAGDDSKGAYHADGRTGAADFKDNYGISGSTWRWIFTVILIISVYESVKKIPFLFKNALKFLSQFEIVSSLIPTKMIAEVFTITTPKDFVEICKNVKEDNKN